MPNWKKVITSGSNATLNHITASGNISASGNIITSKTGLPNLQYIDYNTDGININVDDGAAIKIDKDSGAVIVGDAPFPQQQTFTVVGNMSASGLISTNTLNIASTADGGATIGNDQILHEGSTGNAADLTVGAATNATNATNITTAAESTNAERFVTFAASSAATQQLKTDAGIKYNPSTNKMTVGRVAGTDIDAGTVTVSDAFDLRAGNGGIGTSGGVSSVGINNSSTYGGGGRMTLTGGASSYIEATGYISSSVSVNAPTGSFEVLTGDTSQATSLEVEGPITGSSFRGTKHILVSNGFYVNDNPFVQNSLYFGGTLQHNPFNWNDPQAIGGDPMTVTNFDISDDDQNWGRILPFDVSKIEILCGLRPGGTHTDQFSLVLYTASRVEGAVTTITLTRIAQNGVNFDCASGGGRYANNDLTYTGNLTAGTMIYVGVGTNTSGPTAKNARGYMSITLTAK
tara:strand:+ start:240 stop:1622 length:1383 start_codon:yes stop_codon:yes gene_type:complete